MRLNGPSDPNSPRGPQPPRPTQPREKVPHRARITFSTSIQEDPKKCDLLLVSAKYNSKFLP